MDDALDGHTAELIALLELRARYVEQEVNDRYRPRVARLYLPRFLDLHRAFVGALKRGALAEARAIEDRIFELSSDAARADSPRLLGLIFNRLIALGLGTGRYGLAGRIVRRRNHTPHFDPGWGLIGCEYLQPERIGVFDKADEQAEEPPAQADLKRRYLAMLFEGKRVGYKSAQALLRAG